MKKITTIIVALLMFLLPFSKTWLVISFQINRDFIAKTLCIKKEIENNTCQGQCQLKKQLKEAEQEEQKQNPQNTKSKVEVWYFQTLLSFDFLKYPLFFESKLLDYPQSNLYTSSFLSDIFRPPQVHLI
jgi:hypothetical protein